EHTVVEQLLSAWIGGKAVALDDPHHRRGIGAQLVQRDPFVGGVGLGDVAGAEDDGVKARGGKQRGFGPEVDGVADGQPEVFGEVARGEAALFGAGGITRRQRGAVEGGGVLAVFGRKRRETRVQLRQVVRRQRPETEAYFGLGRDHV